MLASPAFAVDQSLATGGAGSSPNGGNGGLAGDPGSVGATGTGTGGTAGNAGVSGVFNGEGGFGGAGTGDGGGGGGGGGLNNTVSGNITTSLTGGAGGGGGNGDGGGDGGGGGGGGGGTGAIVSAPALVTVSATVTGGAGGISGSGGFTAGGDAGGAGGGGAGIVMSTANGLTVNAAVTGGAGGNGVDTGGGPSNGGDGGGGAGIFLQASSGGTVKINSTVTGGASGSGDVGATGGSGISSNASAQVTVSSTGTVAGGFGNITGNGGAGIFLFAGGTITNAGTIQGGGSQGDTTGFTPTTNSGGNGGGGAQGYQNGASQLGLGGVGITGSGITVVNSGTISGGSGNGGVADAILFTGGTNVLQLQNGYSITGNVVGTGSDTFQLGGTANGSFDVSTIGASAQYQGFGAFQKVGSSAWTLSGTNISAMSWSVNAGSLLVNGSMSGSSMTVNNGGTLGGTGTVGSTSVNAGGTFAPGSGTPGTSMSVMSLAMTTGAIYAVQINPTTASFATSLVGTTLGGATVNAIFANGSYVSKQYTILNSILPISGTFNATVANTNLPANFADSLSYDSTHAYLNLTLSFMPTSAPDFGGGLSGNQNAVGNTLVNFFNTTGGIPAVFGSLTPNGLTQISGETTTGSQQTTFNAMGQFMGAMTDPFMGRGGGTNGSSPAIGYAATSNPTDAFAMFSKAPPANFEQRWSVWASAFGGSQSTSGNTAAGSNNTTSSIAGTAVGADYLFSPNTIAGFALAGGGTSFSVANGGTGRSDLFQMGAYVRHTNGPAYISAALAYGWQDITTNRTVTVAGLDQLRAQFDANAWSGRLEGGYRFVPASTFGVGITPYAAAQFVTFDLPSYAEQAIAGTNNFALSYGAHDASDARTELGIRTDKSWLVTDGVLTLRGRFAWAHDCDPNRSIGATFQTLPGASFVVNGAAQASDSALTTASVEVKWKNGWSAAATFEGEFSSVTTSYAGKGVVRYQW